MALSKEKRTLIGLGLMAVFGSAMFFANRYLDAQEGQAEVYDAMRSTCLEKVSAMLKAQGVDPSDSLLQLKISLYCDCTITEMKARQLASSSLAPDSPEGQATAAAISRSCWSELGTAGEEVFYKGMRDDCMKSGPANEAFCDCMVAEAQRRQLASSLIAPNSPEGEARADEMFQVCVGELEQ